nr:MAG TPA: hypothetical protein [Caudoviricetes sp.]
MKIRQNICSQLVVRTLYVVKNVVKKIGRSLSL